jgi:diaminopimelate epimerase
MRFTKMHGAGNDFVVIKTDDERRDWPPMAIAMYDRHFGIGGDGLLLVLPSKKADFQMLIFNADGSESDACGNGLRCVVKYFVDVGLSSKETSEIYVETKACINKAVVAKKSGKVVKVTAGMGEPKFSPAEIPVKTIKNPDMAGPMITCPVTIDGKDLKLNLVPMGNPHAVYFYRGDVNKFPLAAIGPKVENHRIFPERTNFEIARVADDGKIEARTWERGCGETMACGSGACAITVAAHLHGYINNKASIKEPGGTLEVEWGGTGEVLLTGPAETVFSGEWPDN